MAPCLKVAHVRFDTVARIQHELVVVHLVGDHAVDLVGWCTSTDVLSVSSTASLKVMGINTAGGGLLRDSGESIVPGNWIGTVIASM